ncbi:hypothetical protein TNCT_385591 [Trichonephila clavata]|uniref:Uncharacterized protein n=1 Tax=Trichonephila clavata TaxID=2740835 RepID=A0A8X6J0Y4_TRICU|nr:hypothetical protein TNCT_385591 [Trichonephila clavata]
MTQIAYMIHFEISVAKRLINIQVLPNVAGEVSIYHQHLRLSFLISFRNVNLSLLQSSEAVDVAIYEDSTPILRLDDDDTATHDVVAICLRLAVFQYDLGSKPCLFHWHGIFLPSLDDCQIIRLVDNGISRDVFCVRDQALRINSGDKYKTTLIRNTITIFFSLETSVGNGC